MIRLSLNVLPLQARGKALCELLCFLCVADNEGVEVPGTANLEFGLIGPLADLNEFGVAAAGLLEKVPNVSDLLRHDEGERWQQYETWQITKKGVKEENRFSHQADRHFGQRLRVILPLERTHTPKDAISAAAAYNNNLLHNPSPHPNTWPNSPPFFFLGSVPW